MAKLGEVCTIVSGSTPKTSVTSYWDGNIKWITPAELNEDTFYIMDSVRRITEEGKEKTGLSYLPTGTVILSSRAPIGKTAIAGCEMCCNQGFKNLICSDAIYNEYLYFFLKSKTDYLNSLGRGATFKEISKSIVENIEIPLPEVNQQKEIAEKFKKLEQLISLRKQQLAKLDELVKARFVEMFGEISDNSMNWDCFTIGKLISTIESGWSGNGKQREKHADEIAVLKVSAVTKGYFIPTECKVLDDQHNIKKYVYPQKGDILFSRANTKEMVGATVLIKKDYPDLILPDKLWKIRFCTDVNPIYMKHVLSTTTVRNAFSAASTGTSGSMYNVSMEKFKGVIIPVPPLSVQNEFAAFVERVDQQKQTVQQSLEKLELMKKALMQEYFG